MCMSASSSIDLLSSIEFVFWELDINSLTLTTRETGKSQSCNFLRWQETIHPEDRDFVVNAVLDTINEKRGKFDCQFRLKGADSGWTLYRMRGAPVRHEGPKFSSLAGTLEDFSLYDEKVAELQRRVTKLEGYAKEKNDFFASVTHELRTPMTGVLGIADLLLDSNELSDDHRSLVTTLKQCGTSLLALINDTLDLAKLEARKLTLVPAKFEVRKFISDIELLFTGNFKRKNLTFVAVVDPAVDKFLTADANRLQQVLVNLIGNAQKFTPLGGGIVLRVTAEEPGVLSFSVADSGIGIQSENQQKIFSEYTQEHDTTGVVFGGTGLGLSIARELVLLFGGDLKVRSEPGKGTVFQFTVCGATDSTDANLSRAAAAIDAGTRRSLRILLAEDNPVNQKVASRMLEKNGHTVVIAANGRDALTLHEKEAFDVILMDIQMPVMSGDQATRMIRDLEKQDTNRKPIPIIALTAHAMSGDREKYLALGMDDYVSKPINRQALLEAIWNVVGEPQASAS